MGKFQLSDALYRAAVALATAAMRARQFCRGAARGPEPLRRRQVVEPGKQSASSGAAATTGANVPATLRDPGAIRFWIAIVLTGLCAGLGAAALTWLFKVVQELAWGVADPSALIEACADGQSPAPHRHAARRRARDGLGSMAAQAACQRQQHRRHDGDLVSGRTHAGGPNTGQRRAVDHHRRHGRPAWARRRPQAVRRGVRQSVLEPSEALRRRAPPDRRDRRRRRHGGGL